MRQGMFAALLGCVSLFGCAANVEDDGSTAQNEAAASDTSCRYKCTKCRPGMACIQVCETIGKCPTACTSIAMCVEGYTWDDKTCQCVPTPTGEACGSTTCGAGQVCCNASCGICTEPGGFCTQQICDGATL